MKAIKYPKGFQPIGYKIPFIKRGFFCMKCGGWMRKIPLDIKTENNLKWFTRECCLCGEKMGYVWGEKEKNK